MKKKKLIKVSTVPMSLDSFCRGQLQMLSQYYDVVAVSSPEPELKMIAEIIRSAPYVVANLTVS